MSSEGLDNLPVNEINKLKTVVKSEYAKICGASNAQKELEEQVCKNFIKKFPSFLGLNFCTLSYLI